MEPVEIVLSINVGYVKEFVNHVQSIQDMKSVILIVSQIYVKKTKFF